MNRSIFVSVTLLVCIMASTTFAGGRCSGSRGGGYRGATGHHARHSIQPRQVYQPPHARVAPVGQAPVGRAPVAQMAAQQATVANSSPAPIANSSMVTPRSEAEEVEWVVKNVNEAMEAFRVGNNHQAMELANRLIASMPNHSDLLQFRSLIHLRSSDWTKAAADMYESVQHGAIWSQEQVEGVYGEADRYQNDIRMLRLLAGSQPENLATQFLSAYHHLVARELDSARKALQQILTIKPNEPVAVALLRQIDAQSQQAGDPAEQSGAQLSKKAVTHTGS